MTVTIFGHHSSEYINQVRRYAKRLEAQEIVIHKNASVSLYCKYGIICENYFPTARELK